MMHFRGSTEGRVESRGADMVKSTKLRRQLESRCMHRSRSSLVDSSWVDMETRVKDRSVFVALDEAGRIALPFGRRPSMTCKISSGGKRWTSEATGGILRYASFKEGLMEIGL